MRDRMIGALGSVNKMTQKSLIALMTAIGLTACSSDKPVADKAAPDTPAAATDQIPGADQDSERRRVDCFDLQWKAAHLGLWYNLCSAVDRKIEQ